MADPNPDVNVAHVPTSPTASSIHAGSDGFLDGLDDGGVIEVGEGLGASTAAS